MKNLGNTIKEILAVILLCIIAAPLLIFALALIPIGYLISRYYGKQMRASYKNGKYFDPEKVKKWR